MSYSSLTSILAAFISNKPDTNAYLGLFQTRIGYQFLTKLNNSLSQAIVYKPLTLMLSTVLHLKNSLVKTHILETRYLLATFLLFHSLSVNQVAATRDQQDCYAYTISMPQPKSTTLNYEELASKISQQIGRPARTISRFTIGHDNFVYDIEDYQGEPYVIRISPLGKEHRALGSLYWYNKFEPLAIPLPKVISHGMDRGVYALVLERLPGTDLGNVYSNLSFSQKQHIVHSLVTIQNTVATLPAARGYGFASSYDDPKLLPTWQDVIQKMLTDREVAIRQAGIFNSKYPKQLQYKLNQFESYFAQIVPKPFLNDTSIKNVIINKGRLSGVIDIEEVCFGDRILVLGLTRMALLSRSFSTDYIDIWVKGWRLDAIELKALSFYTLLFCLDLMRKVDQVFDNQVHGSIYRENIQLYINLFNKIYKEL